MRMKREDEMKDLISNLETTFARLVEMSKPDFKSIQVSISDFFTVRSSTEFRDFVVT